MHLSLLTCDPAIFQFCIVKHSCIIAVFRPAPLGRVKNAGRENEQNTMGNFGGNYLIMRVTLAV